MSENVNEAQLPSKEEMIKFFNEQIELKEVQFKLQSLNTQLAEAKARELKALELIGQMTNPQPQGMPHTITQEDLDNNPELQQAGLKVGDEVLVPFPEEEKAASKRGLKKENKKA